MGTCGPKKEVKHKRSVVLDLVSEKFEEEKKIDTEKERRKKEGKEKEGKEKEGKKKQKKEKEEKEGKKIETLKIVLNDKLPPPKLWNEDKIWSFGYHKTILGYLNAYYDHCPIKVSPNIIWQLILNQFSKYVNDNSEELREYFVNFKGTKDINCIRIGTFDDVYKYKDDLIEEFCKKISENIGDELTDTLTPNFSTSTKETIIAGKVSIMATFKKYFRYGIGMCKCGIPYIILEGNLQDWENILEKLKKLKKCHFYTEEMEKDILEIINTKKGNINLDFWRKIIMETKETVREVKNCMDYEVEKQIIKGWILDFYSFYGIIENEQDVHKLNEEVINAPITLINLHTGEKKEGIIYSGIRDLKQNPTNFIVEPIINYCLSIEHIHSHFHFMEKE